MWIGLRQNVFYLEHRDYREEPGEDYEQGKEQSKASNKRQDIPDSGGVITPIGWQIIARE